jgi:hypothetical protein
MPLPFFYRQNLPVQSQAFALGGSALTFDLPRESVISRIDIYVKGVIGTGAATACIEGLPRLIERVDIRGSLSGQPELVPIAGLTGSDLYEIGQFHSNALPYQTGALGSAAYFYVNIPIYFRENFFGSEALNLLPAIPAYQMSDLTVAVRPALQATVDTNATPTLVLTSAECGINVFGYYRDTIPANAQFIRGQFEVLQDDSIATNPTREVKFPSGGDFSLLLARVFASTNVKQADSATAGPLTASTGTMKIFDLSRFTKAETSFAKLRASNLHETIDDTLVTGNAAFVWNRGPSELFQTGKAGIALNNIIMQYDATAPAAGGKIRFVYRRLFDPANLLGISRP